MASPLGTSSHAILRWAMVRGYGENIIRLDRSGEDREECAYVADVCFLGLGQ